MGGIVGGIVRAGPPRTSKARGWVGAAFRWLHPQRRQILALCAQSQREAGGRGRVFLLNTGGCGRSLLRGASQGASPGVFPGEAAVSGVGPPQAHWTGSSFACSLGAVPGGPWKNLCELCPLLWPETAAQEGPLALPLS